MAEYTNDTSHTVSYPLYCVVPGCTELVGELTLLPHVTICVPFTACNVPRIVQRHKKNEESGDG
jgi:hypothetical protein